VGEQISRKGRWRPATCTCESGRESTSAPCQYAVVRGMGILYSLRSILLFANIDESRYILLVDTFILVKSNMGRRHSLKNGPVHRLNQKKLEPVTLLAGNDNAKLAGKLE
jgi:hypothetical protein